MISTGVVENKAIACGCALCVRQHIAADNISRGVHGISNHARFCADRKRPAAVRCPITKRLVPDTNPEFDNIVRMMEDEDCS